MKLRPLSALPLALLVAACTSPTIKDPSSTHLMSEKVPATTGTIPQPITQNATVPKPRATPKTETYSVVVNNVRVHDLLFALARDAKLNVDIYPGISGNVTLNAIDQTLPQLLNRIAKQVDMRFEIDGPNMLVMPDTPFLRSYQVNYVNMSRDVTSTVSTNTQIAAGAPPGTSGGSAQAGGNASRIQIKNDSKNRFWESLEKNINDILREEDKERVVKRKSEVKNSTGSRQSNVNATSSGTGAVAATEGSGGISAAGTGNQTVRANSNTNTQQQAQSDGYEAEIIFAANVIVNAETGVISVRGTSRQHQKVQDFIDKVINNARRQVMIEATVVEVVLSDGYQQGIDWARVGADSGFTSLTLPTLPKDPTNTIDPFKLVFKNPSRSLIANINILETYGNAKVLSSPKLSVMNNQTATLKVTEDVVYFNVKGDTTAVGNNAAAIKSFTTTPQTVSVGFFMSITPQIGESGAITLNVRPSISSIAKFVEDPNPDLTTIKNNVPQIRTREMESVLQLQEGEIAVLGGLMEDAVTDQTGRIPGAGAIPIFGELFTSRNNSARKTELVVFIRPTVIINPSVSGDFSTLKDTLPNKGFFETSEVHQPFGINRREAAPALQ